MAGRIPEQFIDDLLARIDIVEVIEQRVPLKKSGRDWSARCPFHDERSPSFTVSPAKQFYHCFGCGAHGSAIKFLMDYDRLEFVDAVEDLASRVGFKVPYEGGDKRAPQEDATDLYAVLDGAAKFYQRELANSEMARAYFDSRGLDAATIERFGLGYAPDAWEALKSALGTNPQRLALLEKSGMLTSGERGTKYDRFRGRVMFPIQDRRGRVIAFGGRVLAKTSAGDPPDRESQEAGVPARTSQQDGPKYLNSPETPLFHKGRELFALWHVRQAHSKIPRLIVVEGYMDVIALFQHGVKEAVATLGTATTSDHAEMLFRNCADVFFCFDGDRAGRQAAWRAVESILPRMRDGRQAFFLFLPEGEDPDSIVRKEAHAGFEQRLKEAMPLSEFFFGELGKDVNLASLDGKARLAERARPLLKQIPDGAFRDLMLDELDRRANVRVRVDVPATDTRRKSARPQERTLVRTAVALLVQYPELANTIDPPWIFTDLRQPGVPLLKELIEICRSRPEISTAALLETFEGREEHRALCKLAVEGVADHSSSVKADFAVWDDETILHKAFTDALSQLDRQTHQQRLDDLLKKKEEAALSGDENDELRRLLATKNPPRV